MGYDYKRIDVDSHIQEKPNTWTSRMSKAKWGDLIPHVADIDGEDRWVINGQVRGYLSLCPAVMPDRVTLPTRWDDVPPSVYEAHARLKVMDEDGVDAEVLYPNVAGPSGQSFNGTDPEYELECVRAYNDFLIEEIYEAAPDRFIPLAIPPYSTIERTVEEVRRAVKRGHKGVILYSTPALVHHSDPYWDPLWATAQELEVPVHYHGGAGGPKMMLDLPPDTDDRRVQAALAGANLGLQAQNFANFLISGILDRFPGLTFIGAESGLGWVPYVLEACDYEWEQCKLYKDGLTRKPSDAFRTQCYIDFWYEHSGITAYRDYIGVDRIMWETDFPHPTSLHPETNRFREMAFEGIPEDEKHMILAENPVRAYRLG